MVVTRDWGGGRRRRTTAATGFRCAERGGGRRRGGLPLSFYRAAVRWVGRRGVTSRGAGEGCWTGVAANVVAVNLTDLSVQNWGTIREARESLTHTSSPLLLPNPDKARSTGRVRSTSSGPAVLLISGFTAALLIDA